MINKLKGIFLLFLSVGFSVNSFCQTKAAKPGPGGGDDKYIVSALTYLKANDLENARTEIDKAFTPETKDKAKALFAKAEIYISLQQQDKNKTSTLYQDAAKALFKLIELKPDYEKATVDQLLFFCGFCYFNDGAKAYNDNKFSESVELMKNVIKVRDVNGGDKKFEKLAQAKQFDSVCAFATASMANSSYTLAKYSDAIALFTVAKNNPITRSASVYESLINAYNLQNNTKDVFATIEEARAAYPDDLIIRNQELNYYLQSGKHDELLKKLEAAAALEPDNSEILTNLAYAYLAVANGKDGKKSAGGPDMTAKAEDAFKNALKLSPENGSCNFNFGALYFNEGIDVNDQMNTIAASPTPDQKKYEELKGRRDALFARSAPYLEKAYSIFSANESGLKEDDPANYKSTVLALGRIYTDQNKLEKAAEMKKKYETMK